MNEHPAHICLECGAMISSIDEWKQQHYRFHDEWSMMRESWLSLEEAADMAVVEAEEET